jgi:DNA-binding MarR family transcriptional regulator
MVHARGCDATRRKEAHVTASKTDQVEKTDLGRLERALLRVLRGSKQWMPRRSTRLEGAGYFLLTSLETTEPARLSDLAALLRLDVSTVSRQVRSLEDAGMVRREPYPDDRRATRLLLNDLGREELLLQRSERHAVLAEAMDAWPITDRDTLVTLIERLATDVETPPSCRASPPDSTTASLTHAARKVPTR